LIPADVKANYLKNGGNRCIYCGSDEIWSGYIRHDDELWAPIHCEICGKIWKDIYKIARVEEYHADEEE
jgi:uncharacterized Zn finger protein